MYIGCLISNYHRVQMLQLMRLCSILVFRPLLRRCLLFRCWKKWGIDTENPPMLSLVFFKFNFLLIFLTATAPVFPFNACLSITYSYSNSWWSSWIFCQMYRFVSLRLQLKTTASCLVFAYSRSLITVMRIWNRENLITLFPLFLVYMTLMRFWNRGT